VFGNFNGHFAFYLTLVPITLLLAALYLFKRQVERAAPVLRESAPLQADSSPASQLADSPAGQN
jgi:hypothetical protein